MATKINIPRHTNPKRASVFKKKEKRGSESVLLSTDIHARAPYNFIPLSDEALTVPVEDIPGHDRYQAGYHTGWIDFQIETRSPTYIRGAIRRDIYDNLNEGSLSEEDKQKIAPFFHQDPEDMLEGQPRPSIPGSSLRGMLRSLMEILLKARPRWVDNHNIISYRSLAAEPLKAPYQKTLGITQTVKNGAFQSSSDVQAGYLQKTGSTWRVRPAKSLKAIGLTSEAPWFSIKIQDFHSKLNSAADPKSGYKDINDPFFQPTCFEVSFSAQNGRVADIQKPGVLPLSGWIVCSDNMLAKGTNGRSPRKNYILVPERADTDHLDVSEDAVKEYASGMTAFQREYLSAWSEDQGVLGDGKPVFFVAGSTVGESNRKIKIVRYFGHSPNFRIPAIPDNRNKAATPYDFVPPHLLNGTEPDLVDALFGWVQEDANKLAGERAGRVSFESAHFDSKDGPNSIWFSEQPIPLQILASPKPTTFQHYLVQDKEKGHDPDHIGALANYCTDPSETAIRGYKYYWTRGKDPRNPSIRFEGTPEEQRKIESQLTRVMPVREGVRFKSRIHFENLSDAEVGALCWVLSLGADEQKDHCHRIGMGKPLGMGAVKISHLKLTITQRGERYKSLFKCIDTEQTEAQKQTAVCWNDGVVPVVQLEPYMAALEVKLGIQKGGLNKQPQISNLLLMLEFREGDAGWLEWTRYMQIERQTELVDQAGNKAGKKINEYNPRPVLPTPDVVVNWAKNGAPPAKRSLRPRQTKTPARRL